MFFFDDNEYFYSLILCVRILPDVTHDDGVHIWPWHTTGRKKLPGVAIGGKQPLITTQEDVWGKATWRGEESLLGKLPGEVHWKPANCGRSSPGPTALDPSLQVQLPPQSPTLHPPTRNLHVGSEYDGLCTESGFEGHVFPSGLCRSSGNSMPHSVTWLYLPYIPS